MKTESRLARLKRGMSSGFDVIMDAEDAKYLIARMEAAEKYIEVLSIWARPNTHVGDEQLSEKHRPWLAAKEEK